MSHVGIAQGKVLASWVSRWAEVEENGENDTGNDGVRPRDTSQHPTQSPDSPGNWQSAWRRPEHGWGRPALREPFLSPHKDPQADSHAFPQSSTRGQAEAGEKVRRQSVGSWVGLIRQRCTQAHIQQHPGLCVLLRQHGPASLPACRCLCDFIWYDLRHELPRDHGN